MQDRWEGFEELVAIADVGTFVGAAQKLGRSSSHVSRAVARIELRMGTRLFDRTTRAVRLTDSGRSIVERCRRLIDDRDDMIQSLSSREEMEGLVQITSSIALGERFIEPVIRSYMRDHPRLRVRIELTNRIVDLVAESFDIGIRTGHPQDDRLASRQVASRSHALLASPAYIAQHGAPSHPDDLAEHSCLVGTNATWHFQDGEHKMTIVPSGRWRCNSGNAVVEACIAGLGICQLPEYFVSANVANGELVPLLEDFRDEPEPIWAVFPTHRIQNSKVRNILNLLEHALPKVIS